jgi:hypothetical protein
MRREQEEYTIKKTYALAQGADGRFAVVDLI